MRENKRGEAFLSCITNYEPRYDTIPGMIKKMSGSRITNFLSNSPGLTNIFYVALRDRFIVIQFMIPLQPLSVRPTKSNVLWYCMSSVDLRAHWFYIATGC